MTNIVRKIIGWIFIIIGLTALLTPLTPGSILILIGADMAFKDWSEWRHFKNKIREKFWRT